jgi:hypothetical protein
MIAILLAAALPASATAPPTSRRPYAAPCQAVPSLCLTTAPADEFRLDGQSKPPVSAKMEAYRFRDRPCRLVGNMDCPKRASRRLWRLGEPIGETLSRSFGLR